MRYLFVLILFLHPACHFAQNISREENDSIKVYTLGEVVVTKRIDKDEVTAVDINKNNANNVASAMKVMPSVIFDNVGSRNEQTVFVRGFNIQRVPVFIDGIPVYVPYDGNLDLGMFTTYDVSKIDVSKGYSSMMYGANTMGGAINIVSRKPQERFELDANAGGMSGRGYKAGVNIGSDFGKGYVQANFSLLNRDYIPLPANFDTVPLQRDHTLNNSYYNHLKTGIKAGFTPNSTDEYTINYIYSHGEKGNPVYLGSDPHMRVRFWQWPYWDKQSIYFISSTEPATGMILKTRFYFDRFKNKLSSFDDDTYTTQARRYAFNSFYDDYTLGGNIELSEEIKDKNTLRFSMHLKNDHHREHNQGDPEVHIADNTFSVGAEDVFTLVPKLTFIPGVSYNLRKSISAESYDFVKDSIISFPNNTNDAFNAQFACYYDISEKLSANFNVAYKNRFATMKDRYSYRIGKSIPNPDLKTERALNLELAGNIRAAKNLNIRPEVFYSHLTNTIQPVSNVSGDLYQMQNTGSSFFAGTDLSVKYTPVKNFALNAVYSFIRRNNLSNPDILFIDVPEHKLFASVRYTVARKLMIYFSGEYSSERINSSDGARVSPAFCIANLQVTYSFAKYLKAEAGINNIFDKNYSLEEGYPEAGRNFYAGIHFNMGK